MDVAKLLEKQAQAHPGNPAIIFKDRAVSFLELKTLSFKLAQSLLALGVQKGDKVGVYLPNCPEYAISYLGTWCSGATCVPLDFMLTEEELVSCFSHAQIKALILKRKSGISLETLRDKIPSLKLVIVCQEEAIDTLNFEGLLQQAQDTAPAVKPGDKDYAIIFYTSGTTGRPKGVLVSYLQLGAPPKAMDFFVDLTEKDTVLCAVPLSHLGGLIYLQNCIAFGLSVVLMERFIPLEFLRNIPKYKVTCFWIVPSMYYAFLQLKEFETLDLSSLRWIVSFGASSAPDALRRFHQYCPAAHFLNGWGLTETNAPTAVLPMGSQKIESVGRPAPWIEVKIFDDSDREVAAGQVGEIVVKGWVVSDGYYKDAEATQRTIRNGWFHTGDLGRIDGDGDLHIIGRKKEMIKVGGEIVFEPEIESVIHKHPEVAEVAVVGIADNLRGEVPKAYVVLKEKSKTSDEELRYFLRQHLAHFKIPHYFEFLSALPKNRAGKIDKEQLRQRGRE